MYFKKTDILKLLQNYTYRTYNDLPNLQHCCLCQNIDYIPVATKNKNNTFNSFVFTLYKTYLDNHHSMN